MQSKESEVVGNKLAFRKQWGSIVTERHHGKWWMQCFLTSIQVQSAVLDSAASNVLFLLFLVGAPANRQPFIFTPTQYFKLVTSVAGHASDWNVNILMKGRGGAQMERMKAFKMRDQVSVSHSHCRCLGTLPPPSSSYETWKSKPHNKME